MSASLVGSEMCIRDRGSRPPGLSKTRLRLARRRRFFFGVFRGATQQAQADHGDRRPSPMPSHE
eukprot:1671509-Alexandrium_andersonii.AAC.1